MLLIILSAFLSLNPSRASNCSFVNLYKSANVVTHKHDYTYGNGKCYCGATKIVEPEKSSLRINLTSYPTSIKKGSSFGLRGTISSNYNIKKVKGYIKQGDTVYASSEDTPNNKKLDVKILLPFFRLQ